VAREREEPRKYICEKCKGEGGLIKGEPSNEQTDPAWVTCPHCQGECVLDWIENIVGKKSPFEFQTLNFYSKKPLNPVEGNAYLDQQTMEIMIYLDNEWISVTEKELKERDTIWLTQQR
jgi:hypothetical protein